MRFDPVPDGRQHPLRRRPAANVNVDIVGVPAEAVPATLQFLVQWIEVDVCQQRRKDSPNAKGNFAFERVLRYR
jgi:hypothetical protein